MWRNVDLTKKECDFLVAQKNKDTLLLKKKLASDYLVNHRPQIKIATKCIAKRLGKVLPTLIDRDQTGYVKNRFIRENIRLISDVIELYEKKKTCRACYFVQILKKRSKYSRS